MKIRNVARHGDEEVELQMTPMIDIVFQLLVFFIMTFKIAMPEGDFLVKMPKSAPAEGQPPDNVVPPIVVKLGADGNGHCNFVKISDNPPLEPRGGFEELARKIRAIVDDQGGAGSPGGQAVEVEFDCDYNLRYEYAIKAVTAVSGEVRDGKVIKVVEKIKFTPLKKPPRG
jgi:biopolymer transport protein ExbD